MLPSAASLTTSIRTTQLRGPVGGASCPSFGVNGASTTQCARNCGPFSAHGRACPNRGRAPASRRARRRDRSARCRATSGRRRAGSRSAAAPVRQPAASGRLHRDAVEHPEPDELGQLLRRHDAFVHQDRQRTLPRERLIAGDAVRANRRLEHVHAGIGELRRNRERRLDVVAAVGVGPEKAVRARAPARGGTARDRMSGSGATFTLKCL